MFSLPTYKRPDKLKNFIESYKRTGATAPVEVIIQGDSSLYDGIEYPEHWHILKLDDNIGFVAALNGTFARYPNEPFYGIICDDHEAISEGWDAQLQALAGALNIVSVNDDSPVWQQRLAGPCAFGGDLIRTAGFIMPPCNWHICGDDWWEMVGRTLGNWLIAPEIRSKHYCPDWTGEAKDDTHNSSYRDFHGEMNKYHAWLQTDGNAILERLHGVFKS